MGRTNACFLLSLLFYYFLNHFLDSQLFEAAKTGVGEVTHIILNIVDENPELNEKHRFFSLIKNS